MIEEIGMDYEILKLLVESNGSTFCRIKKSLQTNEVILILT